jgi:hypothetical protein
LIISKDTNKNPRRPNNFTELSEETEGALQGDEEMKSSKECRQTTEQGTSSK